MHITPSIVRLPLADSARAEHPEPVEEVLPELPIRVTRENSWRGFGGCHGCHPLQFTIPYALVELLQVLQQCVWNCRLIEVVRGIVHRHLPANRPVRLAGSLFVK